MAMKRLARGRRPKRSTEPEVASNFAEFERHLINVLGRNQQNHACEQYCSVND